MSNFGIGKTKIAFITPFNTLTINDKIFHPVKLFLLLENFVYSNFGAVLNKRHIIMRKIILLFSVLISFAFSAFAENKTEVLTEIHLKGDEKPDTNKNRSIIQLPILNVVYDSDAKNIKITSSESVEAIVYIYDHNGNIVSDSNTLNTILQLPSAGSYTIYVEGEEWYGIGYIGKSFSL